LIDILWGLEALNWVSGRYFEHERNWAGVAELEEAGEVFVGFVLEHYFAFRFELH
jgi:hypothetical protein